MPWERKRQKNGKVYVEVDDQGRMLTDHGLVRIKYRSDDAKVYSRRADAIREMDGSMPTTVDRDQATTPQGAGATAVNPALLPKTQGILQVSVVNNASPVESLPSADEDLIEIYTDGACTGNPGPAGLGVVLRWGPYHREMHQYIGHATNNIAELMAIKVALEAIRDPSKPTRLFTDSSYAIGVLTGRYKAKKNLSLITGIQQTMAQFADLQILKVKGHSGHPLNDRVDALARQAITEAQPSP
ncbi:MAG: ribonuclease H [Myxococcota bacterium]